MTAEHRARASALQAVVHGLAQAALGWLPHEPRLEAKRALAGHAYDDARSAVKLAKLGIQADPLQPRAATVADYESAAYGTLKPRLAREAAALARELDPLADEPLLRALTQLATRQDRHADELPVTDPLSADLQPATRVSPPPQPARDPFVEIGDAPADTPHARLNAELLAGERRARDAPPQLEALADAAAAVDAHLRAAAVIARDLPGHWGDEPVDLSAW
jgi:hypothetical protein